METSMHYNIFDKKRISLSLLLLCSIATTYSMAPADDQGGQEDNFINILSQSGPDQLVTDQLVADQSSYVPQAQEAQDLAITSRWYDRSFTLENIDKNFLSTWKEQLNQCREFVPENYDVHTKPYVIFIVHDDNERNDTSYYTNGHTLYEPIKNYAQWLAYEHMTSVTLLFFKWSGNSSGPGLLHESNYLFDLLSKVLITHKALMIGFGAGGLLIKVASNLLSDSSPMIDLIVFLGTPVYEITDMHFLAHKYGVVLNFYSTSDAYQYMKGLVAKPMLLADDGSYRKVHHRLRGKVYDIRVQINGADADHLSLKKVINRLHSIGHIISNCYNWYQDLDMNIAFEQPEERQIQLAIRSGDAQEKVTYNTSQEDLIAIMAERQYSNAQKQAYTGLYARDINEKASTLWRLGQMAISPVSHFFSSTT